MFMDQSQIIAFNSHWNDEQLSPPRHTFKRKTFDTLSQHTNDRFILTISGLRRTGKSVLQQQFIHHFCQTVPNFSLKNLLFYSFEIDDRLDLLPSSELKAVLDFFFQRILQQQPQKLNEPVLIALDEVQNVKNWQSVIKTFYDLNPHIKFIITGSSSLYLNDGAESLVGRVIDFHLPCLDFEEFLQITNSDLKCQSLFKKDYSDILPVQIQQDWIDQFETFLMVGGFPDTALMHKDGLPVIEIHKFIRESIIQKVIRKDLKKYFNVQNSFADERLFELCCMDSSQFVEMKNLASETGVSAVTIKNHLQIFEQSHLLSLLHKFDRKLRREIKASKKTYVASPCLMFALLEKSSKEDRSFMGQAVETYAFQKLKAWNSKLYVYKGQVQKDEIDFYLPNKNLMIECKYQNQFRTKDLSYFKNQIQDLKTDHLILSKKDWQIQSLKSLPVLFL